MLRRLIATTATLAALAGCVTTEDLLYDVNHEITASDRDDLARAGERALDRADLALADAIYRKLHPWTDRYQAGPAVNESPPVAWFEKRYVRTIASRKADEVERALPSLTDPQSYLRASNDLVDADARVRSLGDQGEDARLVERLEALIAQAGDGLGRARARLVEQSRDAIEHARGAIAAAKRDLQSTCAESVLARVDGQLAALAITDEVDQVVGLRAEAKSVIDQARKRCAAARATDQRRQQAEQLAEHGQFYQAASLADACDCPDAAPCGCRESIVTRAVLAAASPTDPCAAFDALAAYYAHFTVPSPQTRATVAPLLPRCLEAASADVRAGGDVTRGLGRLRNLTYAARSGWLEAGDHAPTIRECALALVAAGHRDDGAALVEAFGMAGVVENQATVDHQARIAKLQALVAAQDGSTPALEAMLHLALGHEGATVTRAATARAKEWLVIARHTGIQFRGCDKKDHGDPRGVIVYGFDCTWVPRRLHEAAVKVTESSHSVAVHDTVSHTWSSQTVTEHGVSGGGGIWEDEHWEYAGAITMVVADSAVRRPLHPGSSYDWEMLQVAEAAIAERLDSLAGQARMATDPRRAAELWSEVYLSSGKPVAEAAAAVRAWVGEKVEFPLPIEPVKQPWEYRDRTLPPPPPPPVAAKLPEPPPLPPVQLPPVTPSPAMIAAGPSFAGSATDGCPGVYFNAPHFTPDGKPLTHEALVGRWHTCVLYSIPSASESEDLALNEDGSYVAAHRAGAWCSHHGHWRVEGGHFVIHFEVLCGTAANEDEAWTPLEVTPDQIVLAPVGPGPYYVFTRAR